MQESLSRQEIIRQVAALCGEVTSTGLAAMVLEQRKAQIDAAVAKVSADLRWAMPRQRVTLTLGSQQNVLNYPAGCTTGGVLALAVYDATVAAGGQAYLSLEKRYVPPQGDQDQEQAAGGTTFSDVCARPRYWWEEASQIHLWPYSDQAYPIRCVFQPTAKFLDDTTPSLIDARLIIYYTCFLVRQAKKDGDGAKHWLAQYADRKMQMQALEQTGQKIALLSDASFDENEESWLAQLPNWDKRPTVR